MIHLCEFIGEENARFTYQFVCLLYPLAHKIPPMVLSIGNVTLFFWKPKPGRHKSVAWEPLQANSHSSVNGQRIVVLFCTLSTKLETRSRPSHRRLARKSRTVCFFVMVQVVTRPDHKQNWIHTRPTPVIPQSFISKGLRSKVNPNFTYLYP